MDASYITSVAGVAFGAIGTYWTVKTYYLKRQDEQRDRQRQELATAQAEIERQKIEYADGERKKYAAERDFQHLMRQYDTLSSNINTLQELGDRRLDGIEADLRDIKGLLQMLVALTGQTETGIMRHLKREE